MENINDAVMGVETTMVTIEFAGWIFIIGSVLGFLTGLAVGITATLIHFYKEKPNG